MKIDFYINHGDFSGDHYLILSSDSRIIPHIPKIGEMVQLASAPKQWDQHVLMVTNVVHYINGPASTVSIYLDLP
jgi:hypothetical protein